MLAELKGLADKVERFKDAIIGEQHTKNVLIEPVLRLLGFDMTNPYDVITEYSADFGVKKGEKVDYALLKDKQVVMLLEAKDWKIKLEQKQVSQLFRYFSVSSARLGILSNGIEYLFFTDSDKPNTMDAEPFYIFNLLDFDKKDIEILARFSKRNFDIEEIVLFARELKYRRLIKDYILQQAKTPSDDFVALLMRNIPFNNVTEGATYSLIRSEMKNILETKIKVVLEDDITISEVASSKTLSKDEKYKNKLSGMVTLADFTNMNTAGTKPKELFFVDERYPTKTWADALVATVGYALSVTDENFVLYLDESFNGNKGWISRSFSEMQTPKEVNNSGIFVDTCASAFSHVTRIRNICRKLEITETDVTIDLK